MPVIEYRLVAGHHSAEAVERLLTQSCAMFAEVLQCPVDRIRAFAHELPATAACIGGQMASQGAPDSPFFTFYLLEGRTLEQRHRLLAGFTDLVVECLGVAREQVRGVVTLVDPEHWAIAGIPAAQARRAEVEARAHTARR